MILVDTSVWIEYLRKGNPGLRDLLLEERVMCHTHILGELACGNMKNREEILTLLYTLPRVNQADDSEVLHLVETKTLYGRGIGWIDAHLLAAARITGCALWTLDRRLQRLAKELSIPNRSQMDKK